MPSLSRDGDKPRTQKFIKKGRKRPGEVEVDDVRQELDKDVGSGGGGGGSGTGAAGGSVAFEDDGWFTPLLVRAVCACGCVWMRIDVRVGIALVGGEGGGARRWGSKRGGLVRMGFGACSAGEIFSILACGLRPSERVLFLCGEALVGVAGFDCCFLLWCCPSLVVL